MSQLAKPDSNGGKASKRKSDAAAAAGSPADTAVNHGRAVRQRTDQTHRAGETAAAATAAAGASLSSSSTPPAILSFLRLAVVERQLIMQGLDLRSLAHLASTCQQMRPEALNKEAVKFIHDSHDITYRALSINGHHSAHDSPLFRKHAPMTLSCCTDSAANAEALIPTAARFSRVVSFEPDDTFPWTEKQMLQLLSLPCMQHVTTLNMSYSMRWVDTPLVQTVLLGLPRLESLELAVGPETKLLSSAVVLASKLSALDVEVRGGLVPNGSLRALRLAPRLTSLSFDSCGPILPLPGEFVWCLPPTLTNLEQRDVDVFRDTSRPLLKALFSRTPLLSALIFRAVSIEAILRGLLDAGVAALPSLRSVEFGQMAPDDCSVRVVPDPLESIFRRFVRRFPRVTVSIRFVEEAWDAAVELCAVLMLCRMADSGAVLVGQ